MNTDAALSLPAVAGALLGMVPVMGLIVAQELGPLPESTVVGIAIAVLFFAGPAVGLVVGMRVHSRRWQSAGESVGLTPEGEGGGTGRSRGETDPGGPTGVTENDELLDGSLERDSASGTPALTGTVEGRPVRVEKQWRRVNVSGGTQTANEAYTHIETPLDPPAEQGVVLFANDADGVTETTRLLEESDASVVRDGEVVAVGTSDLCTQAVATGRSRQAFLQAESLDELRVGDPSDAFGHVTEAAAGDVPGFATSVVDDLFEGYTSADPSTATNHGNRDVLTDSTDLERQVRAVVAAADAFEDARDRAEQYA